MCVCTRNEDASIFCLPNLLDVSLELSKSCPELRRVAQSTQSFSEFKKKMQGEELTKRCVQELSKKCPELFGVTQSSAKKMGLK